MGKLFFMCANVENFLGCIVLHCLVSCEHSLVLGLCCIVLDKRCLLSTIRCLDPGMLFTLPFSLCCSRQTLSTIDIMLFTSP